MSKKIIAKNRKAQFEYHIVEKYEGGIVLNGSEVKALREGKGNIKESYVRFLDNELYIIGMHIGEYSNSGYTTHNPTRLRKLLLHKKEITKIDKEYKSKGITIIPTKLYFKKGLVKIEFCIAKGKKIWDKRAAKKEKDIKREIDRNLKD